MVDSEGPCEYFKFFELILAIMCYIFCVDFLEEGGVLLDFGYFFLDCFFAADLFDLFGLEVILPLKFGDLGQLFVEVADLLLQGPQIRLVLFIYSLDSILALLTFLWLMFF